MPPRDPPPADDTEAQRVLEQWEFFEKENDYGDNDEDFDPAEWIPF